MQKRRIPLAAVTLSWALCNCAVAQDAAQNTTQAAPKSASQSPTSTSQQTTQAADASAQPMSLADMARLARAKKASASDAKPAKVILDDDNMRRGTYAADTAAASGAPSGSAGASGPLSEYHGKVVMLDFWATWCGPCRRALPGVKKLQAMYGGDQFVVVSVNEDDEQD